MKNRWYRYFWTELGRRAADNGSPPVQPPPGLPAALSSALSHLHPEPRVGSRPEFFTGAMLGERKNRHVYSLTWEILRPLCFRRPLRLEPWPDVDLLVPFVREGVCVIPQSFASRIPARERALSLVGRSIACRQEGYEMVSVLGRWDDRILDVLAEGRVFCCALDRLEETLCSLC
jgi:hypothetical protein